MHEKSLVKLKYTAEAHIFNCDIAYITFNFQNKMCNMSNTTFKRNCLMLLSSLAVICMLQRCTAA